jgi:hypothetical protein
MAHPRNALRLEAIYRVALRLYPAPFRERYSPAMLQAFRDALRDPSLPGSRCMQGTLLDLMTSIPKEYLQMLRESLDRPALAYNAVILAGISTILALCLYAIPQQVLRQGLNDPQIQLAGDLAARLERGLSPADTASGERIDMAQSLAPFAIVYDDQGHPMTSQAELNGSVPAPPAGVFDFVRQHGEERVSWQPVPGRGGVRIAAVVQRVRGPHPGFVLAGRNMREVEARENQVGHMAGLAWLAMLGLILVGTIAFAFFAHPRHPELVNHPTA